MSGSVHGVLPLFNFEKFIEYDEGVMFGEVDILFYQERRHYCFKACSHKSLELLVLTKKHFKK